MPPVGFKPTISAGEQPQTYALDRAATGTDSLTVHKSGSLRWEAHGDRVGERTDVYVMLVVKSEGISSLEESMCLYGNTIQTNLVEMVLGNVDRFA